METERLSSHRVTVSGFVSRWNPWICAPALVAALAVPFLVMSVTKPKSGSLYGAEDENPSAPAPNDEPRPDDEERIDLSGVEEVNEPDKGEPKVAATTRDEYTRRSGSGEIAVHRFFGRALCCGVRAVHR